MKSIVANYLPASLTFIFCKDEKKADIYRKEVEQEEVEDGEVNLGYRREDSQGTLEMSIDEVQPEPSKTSKPWLKSWKKS